MRLVLLCLLVGTVCRAQESCPENEVPEEVEVTGENQVVFKKCSQMTMTESTETVETIQRTTTFETTEEMQAEESTAQCAEGEIMVGFVNDGDKHALICATPTNAILTSVSTEEYTEVVSSSETVTIITRQDEIISNMRFEKNEEGETVCSYSKQTVVVEEFSEEQSQAVEESEGCMCLCAEVCDYVPVDARKKRDTLALPGPFEEIMRTKRQARKFKSDKKSKKDKKSKGKKSKKGSKSKSKKSGSKSKSGSGSGSGSGEGGGESELKKVSVSYVLEIEKRADKQVYVIEPAQNIELCPEDQCDCGCTCAS